ncbi:Arc family DNA-binding protein [Aureimonas ureilytica]|uniref:Arc family DNA-binding protein n=1 Tax=Aureimonas ureilytica TaxID=401562 RepID=UPI00036081B6|nr:Arc family DNA-binding protein [Aureimonas ureilytica]
MVDDRNDPQYKLRMTQALKDKLQASARANNRTLNAEINLRLESSFQHLQITLFGDLVPAVNTDIPKVSDRLLRLTNSQSLTVQAFKDASEEIGEILQAQSKLISETSIALANLNATDIVTDVSD